MTTNAGFRSRSRRFRVLLAFGVARELTIASMTIDDWFVALRETRRSSIVNPTIVNLRNV
jgi:hypothetical protein